MTSQSVVAEFQSHRRFAFVGVSRSAQDFSRQLFRDLIAKGYDPVPVNPTTDRIEGRTCYPRIQDVQPPVAAAYLITPPAVTQQVVRDCAQVGVHIVWMHRGAGKGAVSAEAVEFCRERGMRVVPGACAYMFLPATPWFHRLHGWWLRVLGRKAA